MNGSETFVATGGRAFDPAQPTVVLLHGAGFDHIDLGVAQPRGSRITATACWRRICPATAARPARRLPTIADMADWTAALLDAAGARKARLVGHSMGSLIALETAARHPDKGHRRSA